MMLTKIQRYLGEYRNSPFEKPLLDHILEIGNDVIPKEIIPYEIALANPVVLNHAYKKSALRETVLKMASPIDKPIVVGAKGDKGTLLLWAFQSAGIRPMACWDKNASASGDDVAGFTVTQPKYESLSVDDCVVVAPQFSAPKNALLKLCEKAGTILTGWQALDALLLRFMPEVAEYINDKVVN
jgi:hypothetical protein